MSTINNVPFDINRTATETHKTQPRKGTDPVNSSHEMQQTPEFKQVSERRKRKDRRHSKMFVAHDRRMLKQRRQVRHPAQDKATDVLKPRGPGQIIDMEV